MAKINYDGVLETAHFNPDGQLDWVRVYRRLGSIFTDRVILNRKAFVEQLKSGKRYMVGKRIANMGGMFNVSQPVRLVQKDGKEAILVGDSRSLQDDLTGVPII
jgi:hypothetical protein